jgi:hypothetical protein
MEQVGGLAPRGGRVSPGHGGGGLGGRRGRGGDAVDRAQWPSPNNLTTTERRPGTDHDRDVRCRCQQALRGEARGRQLSADERGQGERLMKGASIRRHPEARLRAVSARVPPWRNPRKAADHRRPLPNLGRVHTVGAGWRPIHEAVGPFDRERPSRGQSCSGPEPRPTHGLADRFRREALAATVLQPPRNIVSVPLDTGKPSIGPALPGHGSRRRRGFSRRALKRGGRLGARLTRRTHRASTSRAPAASPMCAASSTGT